ncbi:MAG: ABC transporter permease subunit [Actinomycetota bacterium]|nr:ABC transporter permease subunit [Actinomycetota bacterium]
MKGFLRFLGKEFTEIVRTWRVWVVPGMLLFMAVSSPILAKLTPALLESVASGQQGIKITIPDPTYLDAYAQWLKNLQQMIAIALLITTGGMIAGERASGTAILVLTKPVSRAAFVVAKFLSQTALLVVATVIGAAVCWGATYATFGEAPPKLLVSMTAVWLAFAVLLVALMTLLSAGLKSIAAGGVGIGGFFVISVLSLWGPALDYSPAGLSVAPNALLAGTPVELAWPLATTAVAVVALVVAGVLVFKTKEL